MSRLSSRLASAWAASGRSLRRFPYMLGWTATGTFCALRLVGQGNDESSVLVRLLLVSVVALPLMFLLRLVRERWGKTLIAHLAEPAGFLLLAAYYLSLPERSHDWPFEHILRAMLLVAALHFAIAIVPFVGRDRGRAFWEFNRHLFLRFFLTTLYAAVLTAGFELALVSIEKLFDMNFKHAYERVFIVMAGLFHPLFFLAGVPENLEEEKTYPHGLKAFTQFALAPLVLVFGIILYVYGAKILITLDWPRGMVALPVLLLSGTGILAALLLHPLREMPGEIWARGYLRWFFPALAPLSLLLLFSVRLRINQYGITEERYLGWAAGCWILCLSLFFAFRRSASIRWIPGSLAIICFIAAFGPLSAATISARSQLERLQSALAKAGLLSDHKITPQKREIPLKEYENLTSILQHLTEQYGDRVVLGLFADSGFRHPSDWEKSPSYTKSNKLLGWLEITASQSEKSFNLNLDSRVFPVEGWKTSYAPGTPLYGSQRFGNLDLSLNDGKLQARLRDATGPASIIPLDSFLQNMDEKRPSLPPEKMFVDWSSGANAYRIYFIQLSAGRANGHFKVTRCELMVLER